MVCTVALAAPSQQPPNGPVVTQFEPHEIAFAATGQYANPYVDLSADASIRRSDGREVTLPLLRDGGTTWKLRVAPNLTGTCTSRRR